VSNKLKLRWFVFLLLLGCIWWLVVRDLVQSGTSYHSVTKNDSSALKCVTSCLFDDRVVLRPAKQVQARQSVQNTQPSAQLHKLSDGIEMLPIEMLRSGRL
jgi:hypothetical protein